MKNLSIGPELHVLNSFSRMGSQNAGDATHRSGSLTPICKQTDNVADSASCEAKQ
jgi:hypothetical protein